MIRVPDPLPYALRDIAAVGGTLKQRHEDFIVHEIPRYDPSGDGEHVLVEIEKTGLGTMEAVDRLARLTGTPRRDIGYAGLKDKHAVTRQWVSLRGPTPEALLATQSPELKVLYADRHRNKLRLGHLAGNRFAVKIRDVDPFKVVTLTPALKRLTATGVPNYFGEQRFGRRGTNHLLGAAYARGDDAAVTQLLLGGPADGDADPSAPGRVAFDRGDLTAALAAWPGGDRTERAVLVRLTAGDTPARAVAAVPEAVRRLWVSALQSRLFNAVVARRIDTLGGLLPGDIAYKHENGACFRVEDVDAERPRADAFEISATGPMLGPKLLRPQGAAAKLETSALVASGFAEVTSDNPRLDGLAGERRPIRVRPTETRIEAGEDTHGRYILVEFALPAGAYATTLLRELMQNDQAGLTND